MNYKNHLKLGYVKVNHRGHEVATSLGSQDFRNYIQSLQDVGSLVGVIPPGFEHRADKISDLFYGTPDLDWLVCWTNNVSDPFQQLNVGDRIEILEL